MTVKIWNRKNNELLVVMEWTEGRLDYKRYRMIISQMFMLAADSCEYSELIATFDNSPQRIEAHTIDSYYGSRIYTNLYIGGVYYKTMMIAE